MMGWVGGHNIQGRRGWRGTTEQGRRRRSCSASCNTLRRCYHPHITNGVHAISNFQSDKEALLTDIATARDDLLRTVNSLQPGDLDRARRGGWSVGRILEHVVQAERLYTQAVSVLTRTSVPGLDSGVAPETPAEAVAALGSIRDSFLTAVDRATEENFYSLKTLGHEEYSVLSVLENAANHDREHAEQIAKTLEAQ